MKIKINPGQRYALRGSVFEIIERGGSCRCNIEWTIKQLSNGVFAYHHFWNEGQEKLLPNRDKPEWLNPGKDIYSILLYMK